MNTENNYFSSGTPQKGQQSASKTGGITGFVGLNERHMSASNSLLAEGIFWGPSWIRVIFALWADTGI